MKKYFFGNSCQHPSGKSITNCLEKLLKVDLLCRSHHTCIKLTRSTKQKFKMTNQVRKCPNKKFTFTNQLIQMLIYLKCITTTTLEFQKPSLAILSYNLSACAVKVPKTQHSWQLYNRKQLDLYRETVIPRITSSNFLNVLYNGPLGK